MTDVFISYSRKDQDFVHRLHDALSEAQRKAWVDWEGIPLTADWWAEIQRGIEAADTFLFIISPDSVTSQVCNMEIEHAVTHNKRLVPIVRREALPEQMNKALARHNWLFATDDETFDEVFDQLIDALNTDLGYVQLHTRLLVRAREWEEKAHDASYLLRGGELQEAEGWLAQSGGKEPKPTELQTNYILASRRGSNARQRTILAGVTIALGVALVLALVAVGLYGVAESRRQESEARGTAVAQQAATATNALGLSQIRGTDAAEQGATATNALGLSQIRGTEAAQQGATATNALGLSEIRGTEVAFGAATAIAAEATSARRAVEWQGLAWTVASERAQAAEDSDLALALALEAESIPNPPPEVQAQMLNAAYAPGTVRVYSGAHERWIEGLAISSDGRWMLSAGQEGTLALWDTATGEVLNSENFGRGISIGGAEVNLNAVKAIDFSPAEPGVAVLGFNGGVLAVVNIATWEVMSSIKLNNLINDVVFSPDGTRIAVGTAGSGSNALVYQTADLSPVAAFEGHPRDVDKVAYSPDGSLILSGADDATARLWNVETGEAVRTFGPIVDPVEPDVHINGVAFGALNGDGVPTVIVATNSGQIITFNRDTGAELMRYDVGTTPSTLADIALSPDRRVLAAAEYDGKVYLFNAKDGRLLRRFRASGQPLVRVRFSPDGISVYGASQDTQIRRWYVRSGGEMTRFNAFTNSAGAAALAFTPDGKRAVVGGGTGDPALLVWDLASGALLHRMEGHTDSITSVLCFTDDAGRTIAVSAAWDGTIRVWNVDTGEALRQFNLNATFVASLALSQDHHHVLATPYRLVSSTVIELDLETGETVQTYAVNMSVIVAAAYSSDGSSILVGGGASDGTGSLMLLNATNGDLIRIFDHVYLGAVQSIRWSGDGQRALVASQDGLVIEWQIADGQALRRFVGHTDVVNSAAYSPDERWVATASYDDTLRIWDEQTGSQRLTLAADDDGRAMLFAPDGTLYSISRDGALTHWSVSLDDAVAVTWAQANRYLRDLTCDERAANRVEPLCAGS